MGKYLCYNGEYFKSDEAVLKAGNRSFNYGDGFFETIRCLNSEPLFFSNHFYRIEQSLKALKFVLPLEYNERYFLFHINRLLQKNRIYKGARIRITFFREEGGLYTPVQKSGGFIMIAEPLNEEMFVLADKGLKVGIYTEDKKHINTLSHIKSCNALFYIMAGVWKQEQKLDDCLIQNHEGKIIEGLSSNLFVVKDNIVYATTNTCGCVDGTMRKSIMDIIGKLKMELVELPGFTTKDLLVADEVFLTNAIQGVRHVAGYMDRRYYNIVSRKLTNELNRYLK